MIPVTLDVDNPLPTADPMFRPMHRTCLDRGCQHRGRLFTYGGWSLAIILTVALVLMARVHSGLLQAHETLGREYAAALEQLATTRFAPAGPTSPTPVPQALAPPAPVRAAVRAAMPKHSVPKKGLELPTPPPVPDSEKWWLNHTDGRKGSAGSRPPSTRGTSSRSSPRRSRTTTSRFSSPRASPTCSAAVRT
jgi:hypothetical protein